MRCMTASPWARRIHAPTSSARSAVVVAKMIERASGCSKKVLTLPRILARL